MMHPPTDPESARAFAISVVARLRDAGHEALLAGGCVRDELLGRTPADYDVATSAHPATVRDLFGHRRTLAIGAAFGVITVLGPRGSGQVEVATFRTDADYPDGRHPAGVTFCGPEEDARRRDFTINGLFLDPIAGVVHDYVGGRHDLASGIVRAIGTASLRFAEDHLRLLRAVRFAAGFGFVLESGTREAVERMAPSVRLVSPERVAAELRLMVERPGRKRALELLEETGLAREVLPEFAPVGKHRPAGGMTRPGWQAAAAVVDALDEPCLESALAVLAEQAGWTSDARGRCRPLESLCGRLRLSGEESRTAVWLLTASAALGGERSAATLARRPWSEVQPWIAHPSAHRLADMLRARASAGLAAAEVAACVSEYVARPREEVDPPPLLAGDDLIALGIEPGPALGRLLGDLRRLQLDAVIRDRESATAWVRRQPDASGP
jgi:poly(A) polymerase